MLINIRKQMKSQKGFTLIELMVVIAIIGVLAAIAVPRFSESRKSAKDAALKADLRTVDSALLMYYANNANTYPTDLADAKAKLVTGTVKYLAKWPKDATGTADIAYATATGGYNLSGANSGGTTWYSPGSLTAPGW